MAKKSAVNRNEMVKRLAKQYEAKRAALKATANNEALPLEERFEARLKLAKLPRNSSKTRIRNRCQITGRPRAYYRKLKMSRIALRFGPVFLHADGRLATRSTRCAAAPTAARAGADLGMGLIATEGVPPRGDTLSLAPEKPHEAA